MKSLKRKIAITLVILYFILNTSNFSFCLAAPNISQDQNEQGINDSQGGYGGKGKGNQENGSKEYIYQNNLHFRFNSTGNASFRIEFEEELENRYLGINLNNSSPVNLSIQGFRNFNENPSKKLSYKYKSSNSYSNSYSIFQDINFYYQDINSYYQDFILDSSINTVKSGFNEPNGEFEDFYVEFTYNTFYSVNFVGDFNYIEIFSPINSEFGLDSDENSVLSWAIYDNETQSWYLIEPLNKNGNLTINIDSDSDQISNDQLILTIVSINLQPTIFDILPSWVLLTIIISVSILLISAITLTKSNYRDYLLNRILHINKGPHRLSMKEVLENENRNKLIRIILEEPGIHFNEILRKIEISAGNLAWHLDILETYKIVQKQRVGQYLIYFPYLYKNPISKIEMKFKKSRTTLDILQMVNDYPGIYQNKIAKRMDLNHKTVKYHLDKLLEEEIIFFKKKGRKKLYYPHEKNWIK